MFIIHKIEMKMLIMLKIEKNMEIIARIERKLFIIQGIEMIVCVCINEFYHEQCKAFVIEACRCPLLVLRKQVTRVEDCNGNGATTELSCCGLAMSRLARPATWERGRSD
jgi:hypothetical protein